MLPLMQQCYESALSAKCLARSINTGETTSLTVAISQTINLALLLAPLGELSRICSTVQRGSPTGRGTPR